MIEPSKRRPSGWTSMVEISIDPEYGANVTGNHLILQEENSVRLALPV
jgi:hypothetical protein